MGTSVREADPLSQHGYFIGTPVELEKKCIFRIRWIDVRCYAVCLYATLPYDLTRCRFPQNCNATISDPPIGRSDVVALEAPQTRE